MASPPPPPPAPHIHGETMLEIFVHRSLRFPGVPLNTQTTYGDGDRLATIGNKILEAAYAYVLFNQRPPLNAVTLAAESRKLGEKVGRWVGEYKWKDKVRHAQGVDVNTPAETRYIMDAYVGAVFLSNGFVAVTNWIGALVEHSARQRNGNA
ncbi:hypothetical protein LXA43DRAFT_138188 [Ganoderma leucocontextum]|nr:hypothetical protein LXA43DRAFT_138188 [Ganoderma leucocontextum]